MKLEPVSKPTYGLLLNKIPCVTGTKLCSARGIEIGSSPNQKVQLFESP